MPLCVSAAAGCTTTLPATCYWLRYVPKLCARTKRCVALHLRSASKVIESTRSGGLVHRFPRLVCPWHTLGALGRLQLLCSFVY